MNKFYFLFKILLTGLSFFSPSLVLSQDESPTISYFRTSPRLVNSNTSFNSVNVISRYNFILEIPANADNSLAKVVLNQQSNLEIIKVFPEKTRVSILTENGNIPIESTTDFILDRQNRTSQISIDLSSPIPSGSKVKIALQARNPGYSGIYQFGVEVFPQGVNPRSLYLGIARFHFYRNGRF